MSDKIKGLILGSLIGDALSLGVHWEYNPHKIAKTHGRVESYLDPEEDSYHPGKKAGDFTHYGDQELVLLESVAAAGGFDLADYAKRWQELFADYSGYLDKASKATLENFAAGAGPDKSGSDSTDLSAASRIAPLFLGYQGDLEKLLRDVRDMIAMTHNNPHVLDAAAYLARAVHHSLEGAGTKEAMDAALEADYPSGLVRGWVEQGLASLDQETMRAVGHFGRACPVENLLPGVVHILAKHPRDLKEGLVESVMTGGDNAARAMYVGTLLGAVQGLEAVPGEWIKGLGKSQRILELLG